MTWTLALIIAALCALYSLGYLTACVVNAPLDSATFTVSVGTFPTGANVPPPPPRHLRPVPSPPVPYDWQRDAEALGWLEGA